MEIYKQEEIKRVEFWLSCEEKEDVELQKELEICYKALAEAKYDVITFISGGAPLVDFRLHAPTFCNKI